MNVKIIDCETNEEVRAKIIDVKNKNALPTITDGWRFNFRKNSKGKYSKTYVITVDNTQDQIEGCLIIDIENQFQDYMAFVEVAPHNRGDHRKYDQVAGCLIAFACRQSFINGKEGYLAFDVLEEKEEDQMKLMELYSSKYHAERFGESTTMIIFPEGSEKLIDEYLKF